MLMMLMMMNQLTNKSLVSPLVLLPEVKYDDILISLNIFSNYGKQKRLSPKAFFKIDRCDSNGGHL